MKVLKYMYYFLSVYSCSPFYNEGYVQYTVLQFNKTGWAINVLEFVIFLFADERRRKEDAVWDHGDGQFMFCEPGFV